MRAPWNGIARVEAYTEIGILLRSPESRVLDLEFDAEENATIAAVELTAGEPKTIWLPYFVSNRDPVALKVRSEGAVVAEMKDSLFEPITARRIVGVVSDGHILRPGTHGKTSDVELVHVAADALPNTIHGYDVVDGLVLDAAALSNISTQQANALQGYLQDCRPLLLYDIDADLLRALNQFAGCSGKFVNKFNRLQLEIENIIAMLGKESQSPQSLNFFQTKAKNGETVMLAIFLISSLIIYFSVIVLYSLSKQASFGVILVPLVATLLITASWNFSRPVKTMIVRGEVDGADEHGQYEAFLQVLGRGRGEHGTKIPPDTRVVNRLPDGVVRLHKFEADGAEIIELQFRTHLFSKQQVVLRWHGPAILPFSPALHEGRPLIRNTSDARSMPATFIWDGKTYAVPALAPGEDWLAQDSAIVESAAGEKLGSMKQQRTDEPRLLIPLSQGMAPRMPQAPLGEAWLSMSLDGKAAIANP